MAKNIIDTLIKLNHQGKSLRDIAQETKLSWQQVWRLIHTDERYKPGKRGFARLPEKRRKEIASMGGYKANELGVTYQWNSKTARVASKKSVQKRFNKE